MKSQLFCMLSLLIASLAISCGAGQNGVVDSILTEIPSPCKEGGEPNLFVSSSGKTFLSWIEYLNDSTDALMFSTLEGELWQPATEIARSTDWFVNWADFPSLSTYAGDDQSLAVHWLEKSATGTYDYDVHVAQSLDGGQNWNKSFILHTDGVAAEHGFVSFVPLSNGRLFATWLDGRYTKAEADGGPPGPMTLRSASFDQNGQLFDEVELDDRICDCCQTDAALTENGPVVVYRDRSEEEVRDIYIVRQIDGQWTAPKAVYDDNWKINGCPVNGPAISAQGNEVAVAWYGMVEGEAQIKIVISNDGGKSFGSPVRVDEGSPVGRVDLLWYNKDEVVLTWLENKEKEAEIKLVLIHKDGTIKQRKSLVTTSSARGSGFPIIEKKDNRLLLAWTHLEEMGSFVRTAFIQL